MYPFFLQAVDPDLAEAEAVVEGDPASLEEWRERVVTAAQRAGVRANDREDVVADRMGNVVAACARYLSRQRAQGSLKRFGSSLWSVLSSLGASSGPVFAPSELPRELRRWAETRARSLRRERKRRGSMELDLRPTSFGSPIRVAAANEIAVAIMECYEALDPASRLLMEGYWIGGQTLDQIVVPGLTSASAKSTRRRKAEGTLQARLRSFRASASRDELILAIRTFLVLLGEQ